MIRKNIDNVVVELTNCPDMDNTEVLAYIKKIRKDYIEPGVILKKLIITLEPNNEVALDYEVGKMGFDRIRRITGYLVGTLDRFNNAKAAEEHDRVKHNLSAKI